MDGRAVKDPYYYSLLGVRHDASNEEIRAAYYEKANAVHPDKHFNDPETNAKFKELGEAYQVLVDPATRETYDKHGRAGLDHSTLADAALAFGMTFGSQVFEEYVGTLSMAAAASLLTLKDRKLPLHKEAQEKLQVVQEEREALLAAYLARRLQPHVEGKTGYFRTHITNEAERLCGYMFGEDTVHIIGYAYERAAAAKLGGGVSEWMTRQAHWLKTTAAATTGKLSLYLMSKDVESPLNTGQLDPIKAKRYIEKHINVALDAVWKINVQDMENTLAATCELVLNEVGVPEEVLVKRAQALHDLGRIFQNARKPEPVDASSVPIPTGLTPPPAKPAKDIPTQVKEAAEEALIGGGPALATAKAVAGSAKASILPSTEHLTNTVGEVVEQVQGAVAPLAYTAKDSAQEAADTTGAAAGEAAGKAKAAAGDAAEVAGQEGKRGAQAVAASIEGLSGAKVAQAIKEPLADAVAKMTGLPEAADKVRELIDSPEGKLKELASAIKGPEAADKPREALREAAQEAKDQPLVAAQEELPKVAGVLAGGEAQHRVEAAVSEEGLKQAAEKVGPTVDKAAAVAEQLGGPQVGEKVGTPSQTLKNAAENPQQALDEAERQAAEAAQQVKAKVDEVAQDPKAAAQRMVEDPKGTLGEGAIGQEAEKAQPAIRQALQAAAHPKETLQKAVDQPKEVLGDTSAGRAMEQAQPTLKQGQELAEHPEKLNKVTDDATQKVADTAKDAANTAADSAKGAADAAKDTAQGGTQRVVDSPRDMQGGDKAQEGEAKTGAGEGAAVGAQQAAGKVGEAVKEGAQGVSKAAQGASKEASGKGASGTATGKDAGAAAKDAAGQAKDQGLAAAHEAKETGKEAAQAAKDKGAQALDQAKQSIQGAAEEVKEKGQQAAGEAKAQGAEVAQQAKEQGKEVAKKAGAAALEAGRKAAPKAEEVAGEPGREAVEKGGEAAKAAAEGDTRSAQEIAGEAYEAVKKVAAQAVEGAQHAVQDPKTALGGELGQSAENVKHTALNPKQTLRRAAEEPQGLLGRGAAAEALERRGPALQKLADVAGAPDTTEGRAEVEISSRLADARKWVEEEKKEGKQ